MSQTAKKEMVLFIIEKTRLGRPASPKKTIEALLVFSIPQVAEEAFRHRLSGAVR
jgi:hypothetical protein